MLQTWLKKPQIEHQKTKIFHSRIFNFTFIIKLWAKMSLSKHKIHNYATVQMVCWLSAGSPMLSAQVWIPPGPIFTFFFKLFFHFRLILKTFVYMFLNSTDCFYATSLKAREKSKFIWILQWCAYYTANNAFYLNNQSYLKCSRWYILMNLDQSVTNKLLQYKCRQTTTKWAIFFFLDAVSLLMKKRE